MHDRDGWPFDTAHIELTRCGPDPEARHSVLLRLQMALSHPRPALPIQTHSYQPVSRGDLQRRVRTIVRARPSPMASGGVFCEIYTAAVLPCRRGLCEGVVSLSSCIM